MPLTDQLEVVSPTGEIAFFDLDMSDGLTNVGRHPSNDVVLRGPGVADFHLVLDHRSRPVQVAIIDPGAQATVAGRPLGPGAYVALQPWDSIDLAGYAMILVEGEGAPPHLSPTPAPMPTAGPLPVAGPVPLAAAPPLPAAPIAAAGVGPGGVSAAAPAVQVGPGGEATRVAVGPAPVVAATPLPVPAGNGRQVVQAPDQAVGDLSDEAIVIDVATREQVVDVDQTATWQVSIANGGALVARFEVHIEGWIDGSWVTISPSSLNLYEGGRGAATVTVTPPRAPTSRAGSHLLLIVVTSPNYPGRRAQRAVTLTINPYFEFAVGEVSPRQQGVNYFRRAARLKLPVQNRGNSAAAFRVEGTDDENQVTFEMMSPQENTTLVRQVELMLEPNQEWTVPMTATPRNFHFVGVGTHVHSLTLTTTMMAGQQAPRAVLAQVRNRPIVGPWIITALLLLLAAIIVITFRPRIESFEFAPGSVATTVVEGAAPAPSAQSLAEGAAGLAGKKVFGIKLPKLPKLPKQLAFLNNLWPGGGAEEETVEAAPVLTAAMVDAGHEVTLVWDTQWAGTLTLDKIVGGERQFVAGIGDPGNQRRYTFVADVRERSTYVLTAQNWIARLPFVGASLGFAEARLGLIVDPVQPRIEVFDVTPLSIVTGQTINITWQVARAQEVELRVNNVPRPLTEARGSIVEAPTSLTQYQLVARSPYWDGEVVWPPVQVAVALPTPVIRVFSVEPSPIVDGQKISVTWNVEGAAAVSIDPVIEQAANLQGQEEVSLEPGKSQQAFTLLASLGEGPSRVQAIATRVLPIVTMTPTPTFTPTPTPTPTATSTPIPTPLIRLFDINPKPIVDGQLVQVIWNVEGANVVEIIPGLAPAPGIEGQNEIAIEQGKTQETFVLRASISDGISTAEARATRIVPIVTATPTVTPTPTPTPTRTPQTPVISVFQLVPSEVVRGNLVTTTADGEGGTTEESSLPKLTWTIIGDATDVEVTGPDFGPIRNLPKEGTLRVPANQSTVYQINVYYNGTLLASATQELTVLEPTLTPTSPPPPPTNTPTPTPTPTPNIVSFSVTAAQQGDQVVPISSGDDIPTYQVEAGTAIKLAWRIENPVVEVRLTDSTNDYGVRSPEDEFQVTVTQGTVFQLVVTGTTGRRIRINVLPVTPPPPAFNVNGTDGVALEDPVTVTWDYPGESQGRILGFRVYRASADNFNFSRVADRFELDNTAKQWTDTSTPNCNRVYYVVAVYEDITLTGDDRFRETDSSNASWNTRLCP